MSAEELREQAVAIIVSHPLLFPLSEAYPNRCPQCGPMPRGGSFNSPDHAYHLTDVLLPLFAAVRAEGAREALEQAADDFFNRQPNGQAYNGYRVAEMLHARAAGGEG